MGLQLKQASSYKLGILSSLILLAAVLAQPYYGVPTEKALAQESVDTSSTTFVGEERYVREHNSDPDIAAQIVTPDSTKGVRFILNGDTSKLIDGINIQGAGTTTNWWRLKTPLAPGKYTVSTEIKVDDEWHAVSDTATVYSLDLPWAQYITPNQSSKIFRPNDNPIRVKVDDQYKQFRDLRTTINSTTYVVQRDQCDQREAGNYLLCDIDKSQSRINGNQALPLSWDALAEGSYIAATTTYTKANNRVDGLLSLPFTIDSTPPSVDDLTVDNAINGVIGRELNVSAIATDNNKVESINFYVTSPRSSDGVCTGNGPILAEQRQKDVGVDGKYHVSISIDNIATGNYCVTAVARDEGRSNSSLLHKKIVVDADAPIIDFSGFTQNSDEFVPNVTSSDANTPLAYSWTTVALPSDMTISDTTILKPVFKVLKAGTYTAALTVTDIVGNSSVVSHSFSYTTSPPANPGSESGGGGDGVISDPGEPVTVALLPGFDVTFDVINDDRRSVATAGRQAGNFGFFGNASVLGATNEDDSTVEGLRTSNDDNNLFAVESTSAVVAASHDGWKLFGFAWYWWLLLVAIGGSGWWAIRSLRQRAQSQEL
jgi:hypothetical protein